MSEASPEFSVLVFDMARTGEPDGERTIVGFESMEAATAYAAARVRSSIEELRNENQTPEELVTAWHVFGEDAVPIGGDYRSRDHLLDYARTLASREQTNWTALAPRQRRFHAAVLVDNSEGGSVWAGGYFRQSGRPGPGDLLRRYADDARKSFVQRGIKPTEPVSLTVAHLRQLLDPPIPPSGKTLQNWKVTVSFVCHDIKFGYTTSSVFFWPDEPSGATLQEMARVIVSDTIALRGDDPSFADYTDYLSIKVEATSEAADYPID